MNDFWTTFAQLTVNGIAVGAIYALVALGLVLIYKATEVLNFAHGDLLVVSAFAAWGMITVWAFPFWLALLMAVAGVALPFALGTVGLMGLFHVEVIPAVFAGASMTATSIGITASVFGELKMLRSREGQIVIGAAVLDDILGIVILAVVVSLAGGGSLEVGPILKLVAAALVFVVAAIGLSGTAAPAFDWLLDRLKAPGEVIVASFVVLTLCCFAATAIGLEAALGAFALV